MSTSPSFLYNVCGQVPLFSIAVKTHLTSAAFMSLTHGMTEAHGQTP
jgi:hypothetical protein